MKRTRRIVLSVIFGLLFGVVCWLGARTRVDLPAVPFFLNTLFSRGLMGFMIGISALRMNFVLHGALMGAISSLPALPMMQDARGIIMYFVAGIVYGIIIELLLTKLFRAPIVRPQK